jgi:hypothetical protein
MNTDMNLYIDINMSMSMNVQYSIQSSITCIKISMNRMDQLIMTACCRPAAATVGGL